MQDHSRGPVRTLRGEEPGNKGDATATLHCTGEEGLPPFPILATEERGTGPSHHMLTISQRKPRSKRIWFL